MSEYDCVEELCKKFGDNVRKIRTERKISQAEIAKAVGVSQGSWFQYEAGNRFIRLDALIRTSIFLHVPIHELLYGEPQPVLSPKKQALIRKYESLDERGKQTMEELLECEVRFSDFYRRAPKGKNSI